MVLLVEGQVSHFHICKSGDSFVYSAKSITVVIMNYQPEGKRNPGRLLMRLQGCYIETGEGHKA
jgi:hypothetical protein